MLLPLLPVKARGRKARNLRRQIDGIRFRTRVGCPWRDVPEDRYGPWQSVYRRLRDWQRDGSWQVLADRLRTQCDGQGLIDWDLNVDFTIARAHQHAAGACRDRPRRRNRQVTNRPTTGWAAPTAGGPRRSTPPRSRGRSSWAWS